MRKVAHFSLACFLVLVATVAAAQKKTNSGIYTAYLETSNVPAPPVDSPKIAPSTVKFLPAGPCSVDMGNRVAINVRGMVAPEVDLSDDLTAQQILQMGFTFGQTQFGQTQCSYSSRRDLQGRAVSVSLRIGDPATFTAANHPSFAKIGFGTTYDTRSDEVSGFWENSYPGLIVNYMNAPRALKQSQAFDAEEARQRNAALDQQRQAEQMRQAQIAARSAAFVKANGVARFVTVQQLSANPFVYQGQVVAIYGVFQQMNSATQGLFSSQDKQFVVSGVPTGRFTQQNIMVMLAGRVLGNIEVRVPVLGPTLVPNLSFVGNAFCQQQYCSDYAINLK